MILASVAALSFAACSPARVADTQQKGAERVTIAWGIDNAHTDDTGMTTADVSLVVTKASGKTHTLPLGTYVGCGQQEALKDDAYLSLKCWWAGGGDDFWVRMDATNVLVVEHRAVDETLDIPAFEPLRSLALEDGVVIVPMAKPRM